MTITQKLPAIEVNITFLFDELTRTNTSIDLPKEGNFLRGIERDKERDREKKRKREREREREREKERP